MLMEIEEDQKTALGKSMDAKPCLGLNLYCSKISTFFK